jgi:hypothetical protein
VHESLGQNNSDFGNFTLNVSRVLIVGLAPGAFGYVLIFSKAVPSDGDTKLFRLKTIKAFFTGSIPTD